MAFFLELDFYAVNVIALVTLNAGLSYFRWTQQKSRTINNANDSTDTKYPAFKNRFLAVYLLVFGADWLQVH